MIRQVNSFHGLFSFLFIRNTFLNTEIYDNTNNQYCNNKQNNKKGPEIVRHTISFSSAYPTFTTIRVTISGGGANASFILFQSSNSFTSVITLAYGYAVVA